MIFVTLSSILKNFFRWAQVGMPRFNVLVLHVIANRLNLKYLRRAVINASDQGRGGTGSSLSGSEL